MSKTTKVTINLSEKSMENLEIIHRLTHSPNKTTAFASALSIAREILEKYQEGCTILVEDGDYQRKLILN